MKIRMITTASGPSGVFIAGQVVSIPEEMSHEDAFNLMPIYAEAIDGDLVEYAVIGPMEKRKPGRTRKA